MADSGGSLKGDFFKLTPAVLQIACSNSTFSNEKAKRLLGYEPVYNYEQSFERVREYYLG
jgi:nucleoside-diphosphate-sugar epimerase